MPRRFVTTSRYADAGESNDTSRKEGAGGVSSPMYSMTTTLSKTRSGIGTRTPASPIRTRFLYSFWAQAKIVGFVALLTRLKRRSPSIYVATVRKGGVAIREGFTAMAQP